MPSSGNSRAEKRKLREVHSAEKMGRSGPAPTGTPRPLAKNIVWAGYVVVNTADGLAADGAEDVVGTSMSDVRRQLFKTCAGGDWPELSGGDLDLAEDLAADDVLLPREVEAQASSEGMLECAGRHAYF